MIRGSSGDRSIMASFIDCTLSSFEVFGRRETLTLGTLLSGAAPASGNVAARYRMRMYDACRAWDMEAARTAHAELAPLRAAFPHGTFTR